MKFLLVGALLSAGLLVACGGTTPLTRVEKTDGTAVVGEVVEAGPDKVVIKDQAGQLISIPRGEIASLSAHAGGPAAAADRSGPERAAETGGGTGGTGGTDTGGSAAQGTTAGGAGAGGAATAPGPHGAGSASGGGSGSATKGGGASGGSALGGDAGTRGAGARAPAMREVTLPAGTAMALTLDTAVASDTSRVEDTVRARLRQPVTLGSTAVLPAGTLFVGSVTEATRSGRVKGRARIAFRFHTMELDGERYTVRTALVAREAEGTKKEDAKKIGIGAGIGAVVGGIVGRGKGAAVGAGVGGGAGTGAVLATRGDEVGLQAGTAIRTSLAAALNVRIPESD
jgi:hypothetical protein